MFNHQFHPPIRTTLSLLVVSMSHTVYAELATSASDVQQLAPIVIEATRTERSQLETPASAFLVQQPDQQNLNINLSETLKGVPGLQLNNRENYAQDLQLSMRGFGARSSFGVRGLRLYVDGVPATMPDGQGQTSNIDLNSLSHIEVLSGAFSSLYGNSSGGAVLTQTREGEGDDSVTLGYSGGSDNKAQTSLVLQGGSEQSSQPAYVISSSYFDTDGYRDHSAAQKVLTNAKLTWTLDDGSKINWMGNHVKIQADDPGGLTRAQWQANPRQVVANVNLYNARKEIEQLQTGITWNKPLNDQYELYGMAYWGQRYVIQYQSIPKASQGGINHAGGVIEFDRDFYGADLRWTGKNLLPHLKLIAGVAVDGMSEQRYGYHNYAGDTLGIKGDVRRDEKNTLWNLDPYLQASYALHPDWNLDAGLRYSNVHFKSQDRFLSNGDNSGITDYHKLLPSVALSWKISPVLMSYISYAQGFETPTMTEMAYPAVESATPFNLKAAESETYEIGLKSENALGQFTAAAFYTQTKNDIVPLKNDNGKATFRNADQTLRQGMELSWNKSLWRDLQAKASYSYIDATFDRDRVTIPGVTPIAEGNYIPGIAKHQAFAALQWQPEQGLNAGLDVRYMDKIYVDDANSDTAQNYVVTAAHLGYRWSLQDWKINSYARVDNLFDKNYVGSVIVNESNQRFFEPAQGRNWSAGLSVTKTF